MVRIRDNVMDNFKVILGLFYFHLYFHLDLDFVLDFELDFELVLDLH